MERKAKDYLKQWKSGKNRKPMIINGARQVGKTWLMKDFGKKYYDNIAYVNFENSSALKDIFIDDFNIKRILLAVEIETGVKISKQKTLIIFDEIQEVERGLTALKYFYEDAPEYHVITAGSLLGISLHENTSFPVGKVDFLNLYPFSFMEFLEAIGEEKISVLIINRDWKLLKLFKNRIVNLLKQYFYIGGMPEAISVFLDSNNFIKVREVQNKILIGYEYDFSKHAPANIVPRIRMLWNSISSQLAKENRKFIYSAVKGGARAKDFEIALNWLYDSGLIYRVHRISKPGLPLQAYEDITAFKLFFVDVGLLGAMSNLSAKTIINEYRIFEEFKGALSEQYVLQQLRCRHSDGIFYWSADKSKGEIDFILQYNDVIYPVEVKAKENLQSKSLRTFYSKYPETKPLRFSMSNYRKESWLTNIPLFAVVSIFDDRG